MRIAICQRRLKHYRIPAFDLLGRQAGLDVTVFATVAESARRLLADTDPAFEFVEAPTRPVPLPGGFVHQPAQRQALAADFDLVILPWDTHFLSTLWPATGRRCGPFVALWGHGCSKRPGRARDGLRDWLGRRADAVLLYSRRIAQRLVAEPERRFDRERVFTAVNAIDQTPVQAAIADWRTRGPELEAFRREREIVPASTAIFVSELRRDNRAEMLIDALELVRGEHDRARLVIVGDGVARGELESRARRRGLGASVIFTGAIYDDRALAPWMLSAAVCCYPCNIGLSLLHAFGYGLPVITSDDIDRHGPEIDGLRNGVNGVLYEDRNVAALASAWSALLADEPRRSSMGAAARRTVTEDVTLPNMIQGMLELVAAVDGVPRTVTTA